MLRAYDRDMNRTQYVHLPTYSEMLAEFTGIMLGDGGITHNQLTITLNKDDDREYILFVVHLLNTLFKAPVGKLVREKYHIKRLAISRSRLVQFCHTDLELPIGNKLAGDLHIPQWIMKSKRYQQACLKGLIDTDGCIYAERHYYKNRIYQYPRLNLVSLSPRLRCEVRQVFHNLGFSGIIRNSRCVQLEKNEEIARYFKVIGTNNPKHRLRYTKILER